MAVIQSLQVFRGFAALAVVAHHAAVGTAAFVGNVPDGIESILSMGYLGVDFFFVLSGFIIMHAHMDDDHTAPNARRYIFKRLVRIFPPYLPLSIGMMLLYATFPDFSASGGRDYSLLSSLFLLPADSSPALSVAWTLVHEMQFYAVFLLFFISCRLMVVFLAGWVLAILVSYVAFLPSGWMTYLLSPMNIEFVFGLIAAWVVSRAGLFFLPLWWLILGVVFSVASLSLLNADNLPYMRLLFALGLSFIVIGFALYERVASLAWPTALLLLGNASFSIYLIHNPLLSVTQRLAAQLPLDVVSALVIGVALSLLVGWVYYRLVERPSLRFFRHHLNRA